MMKLLKYCKENFIRIASTGILLISLLILFCGDFYLFMLLKSFVVQISFGVLIISLVWLVMKRTGAFLISFTGFLFIFSIYSPFLWKFQETDIVSGETIKVMQFNVLKSNEHKEETMELILRENADIVMLEEINEEWGRALEKKMSRNYPHYKIHTREDFFGVALFSKFPLNDVEVFDILYYAVITAVVNNGKTNFRVIGVHSKAPTTYGNHQLRNGHIEFLSDIILGYKEPLLVMGDFNAVPWDDAIVDFKEKTGLTDTRTSLDGTFPSWGMFFKVPIDFIFCSEQFSCRKFNVIQNEDSDHYAISGNFSLEK